MADYDFLTLSWPEFEELSRDLVAADTGLKFESFAAGADSGIDFRANEAGSTSVLQSKHYGRSGYPRLLAAIKIGERAKVEALAPNRYLLATSVELTPGRATELRASLDPYCRSTADIYGRERLNDLLEQHSDVHKRHFKLWITSTTVLQTVLNSGIWALSATELETARREASRFVEIPQFFGALDLLEDQHFCLVAGPPGIGKTTLAKMVSMRYAADGYEVVVLSEDAGEAFRAMNSSARQLFYYDDFLGKSALAEKLNKNEDSRLKQLIEYVRSSEKHRLILTTREYILRQAEAVYEPLKEVPFDLATCTITVDQLSRFTRAMMLVNHLQFSEIEDEFVLQLVTDRAYLRIVDHQNFNPRIIGAMTKDVGLLGDGRDYLGHFILNLDNPERVWDHAFENQLSESQRDLLVTLSTLPHWVTLEDLRIATNEYARARDGEGAKNLKVLEFERLLRDLDGTFVETRRPRNMQEHLIGLQNPSITDYLTRRLLQSSPMMTAMISSAAFEEQVQRLAEHVATDEYAGAVNIDALLESAEEAAGYRAGFVLSGGASPVAWRWETSSGLVGYFNTVHSRLKRLDPDAHRLWWERMRERVTESLADTENDAVVTLLRSFRPDEDGSLGSREDYDGLVRAVRDRFEDVLSGQSPDEVLVDALSDLEDLVDAEPGFATEGELDLIRTRFETEIFDGYAEWSYEQESDEDRLMQLETRYASVGAWLGVSTERVTQAINRKIRELDKSDVAASDARIDQGLKTDAVLQARNADDYIAGLFEGLMVGRAEAE